MAKPELGTKRVCVSCGAKFYDLAHTPAVCPKCGTEQPAEQPRVRRGGNVIDERRRAKVIPVPGVEEPDAEAETPAEDETEEEEAAEAADDDADEDIAEVEPEAEEER